MNGLVSKWDMSEISNDVDFAKEIAKYVIDNAFDYLSLSDPYQATLKCHHRKCYT
jgi:hypothetical protein